MARTTAAKLATLSIDDALAEPSLLGAAIRDPESWKPWRALLAAAFGLPLDDYYQLAIFQACTGRAVAPTAACNYLWLVIGRRGGKSFAMPIMAVFLACFKNWTPKLSPGERAVVLLVASDREQAKILIRYIKGIFESPLLGNMVQNATADTLELRGSVTIEVQTRSYRSVRGRSVCVAIMDELAFWRDDASANPDREVLNAIRASMATFGDDGMVIAASSPYARRGVL
jgi:phage terminase large subunit-like protein